MAEESLINPMVAAIPTGGYLYHLEVSNARHLP
jgi:hypothetical protein